MLPIMTKRTGPDEVAYLRPGEAAKRLRVHPRTLTRMADRQQIHSITLPSGHRRYSEHDVDALAPERSAS